MGERSTQVIFCDISIPKQSFNIYDELKGRHVFMGADANEIFFIKERMCRIEAGLDENINYIGEIIKYKEMLKKQTANSA